MQKVIYLVSFLWLLIACKEETMHKKMNYAPDSTGSIDEVLVVMDETAWQGKAGDAIRLSLAYPYSVLPQDEPTFNLHQVPAQSLFDLLKRSSTLLIAGTLDKTNPTTKFIKEQLARFNSAGKKIPPFFSRKDVWAKPQKIVYIYGKDEADLIKKVAKYRQGITNELYKIHNKKALTNIYIPGVNKGITQTIQDDFRLAFKVPNKYQVALKTKDLLWLRFDNEITEEVANILVHTQPYTEPPIINDEMAIELRDKIGKVVQSQAKGSYMIAHDVLPFEQTKSFIGNKAALESRGLWKMKQDFMGGPFLNYVIDDKPNKRLVMLDAFVYAPKKKKRPLMRKLEVLLKTVQFL